MVRRKHQTHRPVINDASELVGIQHGAILVYVPDRLQGYQVTIKYRRGQVSPGGVNHGVHGRCLPWETQWLA